MAQGAARPTPLRGSASGGGAARTARAGVQVAQPPVLDSLRGISRKLRARFVSPARPMALPVLRELFGDTATSKAGVYTVDGDSGPFHFVTMRPLTDKVQGRIGTYRIGTFPWERRGRPATGVPEGVLEVTAATQHTPVSEHFRLSDFLVKDQPGVWPRFVMLREPLIDKLELVLAELQRSGHPVKALRVLSGYRTPLYNSTGKQARGRAPDSRHQYGDAADVYAVGGSGDTMLDLDGNGRVDTRDVAVIAKAVERVEQAHPALVGGLGIYPANRARGPFIHIDVRGTRVRWGGA